MLLTSILFAEQSGEAAAVAKGLTEEVVGGATGNVVGVVKRAQAESNSETAQEMSLVGVTPSLLLTRALAGCLWESDRAGYGVKGLVVESLLCKERGGKRTVGAMGAEERSEGAGR
jgi:hypothetical protein